MRRPTLGIMWLPVVVGIVGATATVATTISLARLAGSRTTHRFEQAASRAVDLVETNLRAHIALLHGGAGLFSGSDTVTPDEFARFAARMRMHEDYPGALGIGFAPCLRDPDALRAFLARMRLRHGDGFQIDPPPTDAADQTPVEYLEPPTPRNRVTLGYDMYSEPIRRAALDRARDIGLAAATAPLTLRQDRDAEPRVAFLVYVPVYTHGDVPASVEERRKSISGFVYTSFRMPDLMLNILRPGDGETLALTIRDAASGAEMYSSPTAGPLDDSLSQTASIPVAGREWTVLCRARRGFRDPSDAAVAWVTAGLGCLLTASLVSVTFVQSRARHREFAAAELLAKSGERYRSLVAATASIVWTSSPDGDFVEPQDSWCAYTGQPPDACRGRGWLESIHAADREPLLAAWDRARRRRAPFEVEGRIWSDHARAFRWFLLRGAPMIRPDGQIAEWVGLVQDIQDRRHLEESLLQSRKLESLGRLAGGIAHDFNNLLTAIVGSAELAMMAHDVPAPLREHLQIIRDAAERSGVLTGHLLSFARKQVIEPRNVAVNDLIRGLEGILRRLLGENIELLTALGEETGRVRIDPGQFEQVLVNLATNARDAMPSGGVLTVQTANADLDAEYARLHEGVTPGRYVMLIVSDTGVGMDEAVQAHVFEPFFTTKEPGKGTGLGLATCYGIIRQAGGCIWVYSEPGKGALFRIFLPRQNAPDQDDAPAPDDAPGFGTETILLVEDEPMVRQIACAALRGFGYSVLAAPSAEEALPMAHAFAGEIHLLLTDVVLPQMSGKQLADRLRPLRPGLRVLYCSGYTDSVISHHGVLDDGVAFLQKPYTPRQLARKVRSLLDAPALRPGK